MGATHKLLADEISTSERRLKQTEDAVLDFRYTSFLLSSFCFSIHVTDGMFCVVQEAHGNFTRGAASS